jgi:hypothetical protein
MPPAVELLSNEQLARQTWPDLMSDHAFAAQVIQQEAQVTAFTGQDSGQQREVLVEILKDETRQRIALYTPFEMLAETPATHELYPAYRDAWYNLLGRHDGRANFVDGDIFEYHLRTTDFARVVKAAHLAPRLAELGVLSYEEVTSLYMTTTDSVLHNSLAEAFEPNRAVDEPTPEGDVTTEARKLWLDERQKELDLQARAKQAAKRILTDGPEAVDADPLVHAESVYQALRVLHSLSPDVARRFLHKVQPNLDQLQEHQDPELRDRLHRTYRRLHSMQLLERSQLIDRGISVPRLDGPFSENLAYMQQEVQQLRGVVETIQSDETLNARLYPVVVLGGSRLKGYGEERSDIDVGVFVRPEVAHEDLATLEVAAKDLFPQYGKPVTLWLDRVGPELEIHNFGPNAAYVADPDWTHVLFESAWIGDQAEIADLQQRLLPPYFYSEGADRRRYLERLEQDVLQYRLLHKGYARHNALEVARDTDVFWDPGYRRVATKLFASNVFLPKL